MQECWDANHHCQGHWPNLEPGLEKPQALEADDLILPHQGGHRLRLAFPRAKEHATLRRCQAQATPGEGMHLAVHCPQRCRWAAAEAEEGEEGEECDHAAAMGLPHERRRRRMQEAPMSEPQETSRHVQLQWQH